MPSISGQNLRSERAVFFLEPEHSSMHVMLVILCAYVIKYSTNSVFQLCKPFQVAWSGVQTNSRSVVLNPSIFQDRFLG